MSKSELEKLEIEYKELEKIIYNARQRIAKITEVLNIMDSMLECERNSLFSMHKLLENEIRGNE